MSVCLDKLPHTCGTDRGLQVFSREDGTVDGYCFACPPQVKGGKGGMYVRHPYGTETTTDSLPTPVIKSPQEVKEELSAITSLPTKDIVNRRLSAAALKYFDITTSLDESDGETPTVVHYPYHINGELVGYKNKLLHNKRIWSVGNTKGSDLFGWNKALRSSAMNLIITEGEDDAVAVYSMFNKFGKQQFMPAIVSLPRGAASAATDLDKVKKLITNKFKNVILCFDNDDAGKAAVESCLFVLPKARTVELSEKDANDCWKKSKSSAESAWRQLAFDHHAPKNSRLIAAEDLHEASKVPPSYGQLTWLHSGLNEATRGIRYGETAYVGSAPKMGKSEFLNAQAVHFIVENSVKVCVIKPEEDTKDTYKLMCGKVAGKIFDDPKVEFNEEAYDRAGEVLKGNLLVLDSFQHVEWNTLKNDIISAANWGAKVIFIDPITNLTNGISAGETNTLLQSIAQDLAKMALDLDIFIMIFCHLKANEGILSPEARTKYYANDMYVGLGNCDHALGGSVYSAQFTGSRAMERSCHYMIALEGNKDADLEEDVGNMRYLNVLNARKFNAKGKYALYYNTTTQLYREV